MHDLNGEEVKFEENQQRAVVKGTCYLNLMYHYEIKVELSDRSKSNAGSYARNAGSVDFV